MKAKERFTIINKTAIDGISYWCVFDTTNKRIVSKHKLKRDAKYYCANPIYPI